MFKDILQSKWFTAVILVMVGFFCISIIKLSPPLIKVGKELKNINQKIDETKEGSLELERLGNYLQSDAYLERQARLQLNYKKPDEKVVYVYRNTSVKVQNNNVEARKTNGNFFSNLAEWWRYLINK